MKSQGVLKLRGWDAADSNQWETLVETQRTPAIGKSQDWRSFLVSFLELSTRSKIARLGLS